MTGSSGSRLSAIYATDCAAACIKALGANVSSGSRYFVEDGHLETLGGLIGHIENALGRRAWLRVPVPRFLMYGAALASELYGRVRGRAVMLTRDKLNELLAPHWGVRFSGGAVRAWVETPHFLRGGNPDNRRMVSSERLALGSDRHKTCKDGMLLFDSRMIVKSKLEAAVEVL